MAKQKIDKDTKLRIKEAQRIIREVAKADGNESETRRRVERIFESIMGYDAFKHLSREHAVHGPGVTEYCDFAIQIDEVNPKPVIMVELKKVNIDLNPKHLTQVATYAINAGCEWILLTNGAEWKLYHVAFGQPPVTKQVLVWNLLNEDIDQVAADFEVISYRNVKRGGLEELWQKTNVLTSRNILNAILSEESLKLIRKELKKSSGIFVLPEEIVSALRRLLNENALSELENLKLSIPKKKGQILKKTKELGVKQTAADLNHSPNVTETLTEDNPVKSTEIIPPNN